MSFRTVNVQPNLLTFFDSHCHFDFAEYDSNRDMLWRECFEQGVRYLLIPGIHPAQWEIAYSLSQKYSGVVMSAGIHPWWIERLSDDVLSNERQPVWDHFLERNNCVAIGECGLDKFISVPIDVQIAIFEKQLQVACDHHFPVILHSRKMHNEILQHLSHYRPLKGGVIHGFSGSLELANQYWKLGFHLGVGGVITYPRAAKTRAAVAQMPLESLLLETDAPDMPLNGYQGQANSPLNIVKVAQVLAELRDEPLQKVVQQTTQNAMNLFTRSLAKLMLVK